jgi:hypothetical protein
MAWETAEIWEDGEGKLWTLADSSIDLEIFEIIGVPVFDERTRLWNQEIALRISDPAR